MSINGSTNGHTPLRRITWEWEGEYEVRLLDGTTEKLEKKKRKNTALKTETNMKGPQFQDRGKYRKLLIPVIGWTQVFTICAWWLLVFF